MPLDALVTGRIATFAGPTGFGWVEAVGIKDGRVAFAGSAVELETRADPFTERFELEPGEIALPGLIDAHLHFADAALEAQRVDLSGCATLDDGLAEIRTAHGRLGEGEWLQGAGWDQRRWGRWPTAADLDAAVPGRRVALWSFDHHGLWISGAAMAAAGIDAATADPDGGIVRRDDAGTPSGILLENACRLVTRHIPDPTEETLEGALASLGRSLLEYGVVGVHDPGTLIADDALRLFGVYGSLADRGALPVRVHASLRSEGLELAIERGFRSGQRLGAVGASGGEAGGSAAKGASPTGPDRARIGWLKLFADGTLGSRTAALINPIEGLAADAASGSRGVFRTSPEELAALTARAAEGGIATQIHAIGDAAVRAALDALEPSAALVPLMPRLEHVQLCHPDDLPRFARLGVTASVQPVHLREDAETARRDWGERAEAWGYTWRSFLDDGAVLAFGTDAPVEPIDPWPGIAVAVLRRDPSWGPDAALYGPHEALTLEQALRSATVAPATSARDGDRGRLVPGAPADLIVLPPAPSEPDARAAAFAAVRPRLVLVDGKAVVER